MRIFIISFTLFIASCATGNANFQCEDYGITYSVPYTIKVDSQSFEGHWIDEKPIGGRHHLIILSKNSFKSRVSGKLYQHDVTYYCEHDCKDKQYVIIDKCNAPLGVFKLIDNNTIKFAPWSWFSGSSFYKRISEEDIHQYNID